MSNRYLKEQDEDEGSSWIVTFADLMALLLAFFVLLFSFSTLDEQRYQEVVSSFSDSFSVFQNQPGALIQPIQPQGAPPGSELAMRTVESRNTALEKELTQFENDLSTALAREINADQLAIEREEQGLIIRLKGDTSFRSGSAEIETHFFTTLDRIAELMSHRTGYFEVSGHTDNQPLTGGRYSSNWDLSAARAVAVTEHLLLNAKLSARQFKVVGRADTQPLALNDSRENRQKNRRVEILVRPDRQ